MDKMYKIVFVLIVVSMALFGTNYSFAGSEAAGHPEVEPKLPGPSGGANIGGDEPLQPGVIQPGGCKNPTGFRDCYNSQTQYCDSDHLVKPSQCRRQAYTQCSNAYCK
jgi:hypothetical protein